MLNKFRTRTIHVDHQESNTLEYSNRFGVSGFMKSLIIFPCVVAEISAFLTSAGDAFGYSPKYTAATPATWGTAIDVPDAHVYALSVTSLHLPAHTEQAPS